MKYLVILTKKLVSTLTIFLQSWLYPLLALVAGFMVYAYGLNQQIKWIFLSFDSVFDFLCLVVLVSSVVQFWKRRWFRGIAQLGMMAFITLCLGFLTMFYPWDYYADDLKLPEGIYLEKPENKNIDSVVNNLINPNDFRIANSIQPGIYRYYAKVKLKQPGTLYLKAYEITHNAQLSPKSLKERTASKALLGEMALHHQEFYIFEGDWGKPYAARFELWFDPEKPGNDHKLLEKNYLIEGWMR